MGTWENNFSTTYGRSNFQDVMGKDWTAYFPFPYNAPVLPL